MLSPRRRPSSYQQLMPTFCSSSPALPPLSASSSPAVRHPNCRHRVSSPAACLLFPPFLPPASLLEPP